MLLAFAPHCTETLFSEAQFPFSERISIGVCLVGCLVGYLVGLVVGYLVGLVVGYLVGVLASVVR